MDETLLIRRMSADTGLLPSQVAKIVQTAPLRYKVFTIPKRQGGFRVVAQPAKEVKALQYWIIEFLRPRLPMHAAASAYNEGCSITANARVHQGANFLLKLDFEEFFPSIHASDIKQHLRTFLGNEFSSIDLDVIARVLCWVSDRRPPLKLCIGAPSSPFISNSIMCHFDEKVSTWCQARGIAFTRYADDLAFSSRRPGALKDVRPFVDAVLHDLVYPRLRVNEGKTVNASRKVRMSVTGLNITPERMLSIGRFRKRQIRAMYHRSRLGLLDEQQTLVFKGHLAFAEDVEPGFTSRLIASYERKDRNGE